MRRHVVMFAIAALLVGVMASSPRAHAALADTRGDRDQVRAQQTTVAANLDVLKADQRQVESALEVLQTNVATEEGRLEEAERAVAAAQSQIEQAEQGIRNSTAALDKLQSAMTAVVVEAYIEPENSALAAVLDSHNANEVLQRRALRSVKSTRDADLTDKVRALTSGLEAAKRDAAAAKRRAAAKQAEVTTQVQKVRAAKAEQQKVVDAVQGRIDGQIARSVELATQDKQLSYKLALEQAALQARLLAQQAASRQAAAQAASAAAAASTAAYGDGGSESNGPVAGPGTVRPSGGGGGGISLCAVGGITVNCQISSRLQSLLSAAAADGVSLGGGGYRDPSAQISLRQQHCGSSYYAIYQMSASSCRPPTARPGSSQHEVGLAIDFSNCNRGSSCYNWLRGNASRFGFFNLPSESWHWSINGN